MKVFVVGILSLKAENIIEVKIIAIFLVIYLVLNFTNLLIKIKFAHECDKIQIWFENLKFLEEFSQTF